jgi:hypothetical protein
VAAAEAGVAAARRAGPQQACRVTSRLAAKTAAEGKGGKPADAPAPSGKLEGKLGFASKKRRRA